MSFWRQEDPVLNDEKLVVTGGMWQHQRDWWHSPHYIKALVMGYGGGKTLISAKRAISMCMENAPVPYMYVSPSYKLARRTIMPTLEELLDGRKIKYSPNKSLFEYKIKIKKKVGTIWIASGDDPKSLKGPNLCGANIDEPFIQDKEVFDQMMARVRDTKAKSRKITLTGTPEDLNWGYDICEGDDKGRYDIGLIQAPSYANLALPADYIESLQNAYDDVVVEAYVEGKFVNMAKGRVYYGFERGRNVVRKKRPDGVPLQIGQDFNVDPMASALFWTEGPHMHIEKELELRNSDTEDMVIRAQEYAAQQGTALEISYPDPSGKARKTSAPAGRTDFTIIKYAGIQVKARIKAPPIRDRRNAVNKKWKDATLTVSPDCKKVIKYSEQLSHELFTKQEEMTHLTDAIGYPVEYLYPIRRPIIQGR